MHDGLVHSMSVDWDRRRRFESPRGQMCFSTFYKKQKHDQRRWPPLFRLCKMYKEPSLRPRPLWRVFPVVKKHIKENSVEAESSGSRWVKWNRSLVSAWKHNTVPNYLVPGVDMLIWADTEKFALWKFFVAGHRPPTGYRPATLAKNAPLVSNTGLMISVTCCSNGWQKLKTIARVEYRLVNCE